MNVMSTNIPQIRLTNIISIILDAFIFLSTLTFLYVFRYRSSVLFKKPSTKFMFSLTLVDCFTSLTAFSHVMQEILPAFSEVDCTMCIPTAILVDVITTFLSMTSVMHLCMLAFDRYISIFQALRYNAVMNSRFVNNLLAVSWAVSFVASSVQITYLYPYISGDSVTINKVKEIFNFEMVYSIVSFLLFTSVPAISLATAYGFMFFEIRKLLLKTPTACCKSRKRTKQVKMVSAFCMMYLCFIFFSVPYFTLRLMIDVMSWMKVPVDIPLVVFDITYIFKTLSSLCNCYIYLIMNKEFRNALVRHFRKKVNQPYSASTGSYHSDSAILKKLHHSNATYV